MPAVLILHKRYTLAFNSFRNDYHRLTTAVLNGFFKSLFYLFQVMSVDHHHFKAERAEPSGVLFNLMAKHRFSALRKPVNICNSDEVIQPMIGRKIGCFPNLSFCELSIA